MINLQRIQGLVIDNSFEMNFQHPGVCHQFSCSGMPVQKLLGFLDAWWNFHDVYSILDLSSMLELSVFDFEVNESKKFIQ